MRAVILKGETLSMIYMARKWAGNYIYLNLDANWKSLEEVYVGVYGTSVILVLAVLCEWENLSFENDYS